MHGPLIPHSSWKADETQQSSTWRELVAVSRVLESVSSKIGGQRVHWFTDNNINVVCMLSIVSQKLNLQKEVLRVFLDNQIRLEPEWVPREENMVADTISRSVEGPNQEDRFANNYNMQQTKINSHNACPTQK